jgi:hypothetical protein
MAGGETPHKDTQLLAEAAYWHGCQHGEIVAAGLTTNDVDDASQVGSLLDQVEGAVASFKNDGAYDQDSVYRAVIDRDSETTIIVPQRCRA